MNTAAIAKIKAMYGKRLKKEDYHKLACAGNVSEAASFLKNHPAWQRAFSDVNVQGLHRGHLEAILTREYFTSYTRALPYLSGAEHKFAEIFLITYETEQILWALRYIDSREQSDLAFAAFRSEYIDQYTLIDFARLIDAKNHIELLAALSRTPYHQVLSGVIKDGVIDYSKAELILWSYYYNKLFKAAKKTFKGRDKNDIMRLFGTEIDLENITRIYRLCTFFPTRDAKKYLLPYDYRLKEEQLNALAGAVDERQFFTMLRRTPYRMIAEYMETAKGESAYIEDAATRCLHAGALKILHFSDNAAAVIFAYLIFLRVELTNLKTVIESGRYSRNSETILPRLILSE